MNATPTRSPYPSDVNDRQWESISVVIPPEEERGRRRSTEMREVVNSINYRWRTGCVWRMLPHDFPPWATVYTYFRRWQHDGTLREIRDVLLRRLSPAPAANGRKQKTSRTQPNVPGSQPAEEFGTPRAA